MAGIFYLSSNQKPPKKLKYTQQNVSSANLAPTAYRREKDRKPFRSIQKVKRTLPIILW